MITKMIAFDLYDNKLKGMIHGNPIITNVFTKKELNDADYLTIRPKKNVIEIINYNEAFALKCPKRSITGHTKYYRHREQIGKLVINSFNTNGLTCFFSSDTGFSELFLKKASCEIIRQESIKGILFSSVTEEKCGKSCESGIFQIFSDNIIKQDDIYVDKKQRRKKCPICGFQNIICNTDYQLQLNISLMDLTDDFYMTEAIFGEGFSYPMFVISKKFYNVLVTNKMLSNVIVEPVIFKK